MVDSHKFCSWWWWVVGTPCITLPGDASTQLNLSHSLDTICPLSSLHQTTDIDSPWLSWCYSILICSLCIIIYHGSRYYHILLNHHPHQTRVCAILIKTIISCSVAIYFRPAPSLIYWKGWREVSQPKICLWLHFQLSADVVGDQS